MVDGARMVTPGLLHFARHAAPFTSGHRGNARWYLGFDFQRWSMRNGHDQAREDALLASIGCPKTVIVCRK